MPYKDPERQRAYKREWAQMRRAGESGTPCGTPVPLPFRIKTASDVLALLEEQIGALRADGALSTVERARTVGYLAGIALKAIEAGDLAARLEAVENVLKQRRSP